MGGRSSALYFPELLRPLEALSLQEDRLSSSHCKVINDAALKSRNDAQETRSESPLCRKTRRFLGNGLLPNMEMGTDVFVDRYKTNGRECRSTE